MFASKISRGMFSCIPFKKKPKQPQVTNYLNSGEITQKDTINSAISSRKVAEIKDNSELDKELRQAVFFFYSIKGIKDLIKQGARLKNLLDAQYDSHPLELAIRHCDNELLTFFLEEGFDPNNKDKTKTLATYKPNRCFLYHTMEYLPIYALDDTIIIPILQTLIDHGADVNIDTGTEYSPLAMAILKHRYEVFQFLLDKGAKINTFIEEDESMSYETKMALYNKYSRLYILELICRGVTIPNDKCLYLLPKFSNYSEENKGNIYKLLTKHGIKTHSDIDRLQLTSEIKEHLKNVLFPLENTQKSN